MIDDEDYDEDGNRNRMLDTVMCRSCGVNGLHWQNVTSADGLTETPRLFTDSNRRHVCQYKGDVSVFDDA